MFFSPLTDYKVTGTYNIILCRKRKCLGAVFMRRRRRQSRYTLFIHRVIYLQIELIRLYDGVFESRTKRNNLFSR